MFTTIIIFLFVTYTQTSISHTNRDDFPSPVYTVVAAVYTEYTGYSVYTAWLPNFKFTRIQAIIYSCFIISTRLKRVQAPENVTQSDIITYFKTLIWVKFLIYYNLCKCICPNITFISLGLLFVCPYIIFEYNTYILYNIARNVLVLIILNLTTRREGIFFSKFYFAIILYYNDVDLFFMLLFRVFIFLNIV